MFVRFAMSQNIAWQAEFPQQYFWTTSENFWKLQNISLLCQAKNDLRAMFFDVAKRSDIVFDKQMLTIWQTMFDRLAEALLELL